MKIENIEFFELSETTKIVGGAGSDVVSLMSPNGDREEPFVAPWGINYGQFLSTTGQSSQEATDAGFSNPSSAFGTGEPIGAIISEAATS